MSLGDRFIEIREYFGLSQSQFAQKINKTPGFVSNVETDRSDISESTVKAICVIFNVDETWLLTGKGDMFIKGQEPSKADKVNIGSRIKQIRLLRKITQKDFAAAIGYSKKQVYSVESGKSNPSDDFVRRVASCFNISYKWLTTGAGDIEVKEAIVDEELIEWLKKNPDVVKELRIRSGLD